MILFLDSFLRRQGAIKNVISATRLEELNGENTLDFEAALDDKLSLITQYTIFEVDGDYFDIKSLKKLLNADNTYTIEVEADHVSYRLNEFVEEYFTEYGTVTQVLTALLVGTGFTIGTVDIPTVITYSAQETKSRREILFELAAYVQGDLIFDGFTISLVQHRGSTEKQLVIKDRNVKVLAQTINKRKLDEYGNPTINYTCTPVHIPLDDYELGDDVELTEHNLGLNRVALRVIRITRNPYDDMETVFEFGVKSDDLGDSLFQIVTETVGKDKKYNGIRIGPQYGFEAVRNDKKARAYFRSDEMKFQSGDGTGQTWKDRLYYAYDSEKDETVLVFDGVFTADVIEALSAIITPNLYAKKGYISELTVDSLETSNKVQKYLNEDRSDVNYIRIVGQVVQFITATAASGIGATVTSSGLWEDAQTDVYYTNVSLDEEGAPQFINGATMTAFDAFGAGRFYRALNSTSYYKLVGVLLPSSVSYDVYTISGVAEPFEQVKTREGQNLYWVDETHEIATTKETDFPVNVYVYNEVVKMEHAFSYDDQLEEYVPRISLGLSAEGGNNGTGAIYKSKNGLAIDYFASNDGDLRQILMNDKGIILTPFADNTISELTVDRLETSTKVQRYLAQDTSDVNFVRIVDQVVQFITAKFDDMAFPNYVQLTNRDGDLLYWFDEAHTNLGTDETDFPVLVFQYIETVKMQQAFEWREEEQEYAPRLILGAGVEESSDNGKGFVYKTGDGLHLLYLDKINGCQRHIFLGDDETSIEHRLGDEDLKQIKLTDEGITFYPCIFFGPGTGTDDNGKGYIYNLNDGVCFEYYSSIDGSLRQIKLADEGILFDPPITSGNIVSTQLAVSIVSTGEFTTDEWEHGFNTAQDVIQFLATAKFYDDTAVTIKDLRVEETSPTTCRLVGYAELL